MKFFLLILIFIYFVLSGYTAAEAVEGLRGATDRIIWADWYAFGLVAIAVVTLRRLNFTVEQFAYMAFLMLALLGVLGARNPASGAVELLVLAFNWGVSLVLLNIFTNQKDINFSDFVKVFLWASALLAIVGLIQFFLYPNLFGEKPPGALSGTFRNTGQAGAYYGVALAVAIPAVMSGLLKKNLFNILCIVLIITALLFTFKRAAVIGAVIGLLLFSIRLALSGSAKDRKTAMLFLFLCVVSAPLLYMLFQYSIENVASMRWRFEHKFNEDAVEDFSEGFFADNLAATLAALNDHPFLGSGLGNIIGQYTAKHEIHSTYLSVLANTGLFGMLFYLVFMAVWISTIIRHSGNATAEQRFLSYLMPFLFGLCVSWIYTYHLRKREFWILFALTLACAYSVKLGNLKRQHHHSARQFFAPQNVKGIAHPQASRQQYGRQ